MRPPPRSLALLGALACAALGATQARGDAPPVSLSWTTPPDAACPDTSEVLADLRRLLGPSAAPSPAVSARARVERVGEGRFRVEMSTSVRGETGSRSLEESSCRRLADAVVVILGFLIDPEAMAARAAPSTTKPAASAPAVSIPRLVPSAPPPVAPEDRAPRSRPTPVRFGFDLDLTLDAGTLPEVSLGLGARARAEVGPLWLGVRGAFFPTSTQPISLGPSTAGGRFSLLTVGLEGCVPAASGPALSLAFCAGPSVDWVRGEGFGISSPGEASGGWLSLRFGAELAVPLGEVLRARLALEGVVPTDRPDFVIDAVGPVFRPGPVALRGALGIGTSFW